MIWPFRRRARRRRDHWWTVFPRLWRWAVWVTRLLLLLFIVDLFYLGSQWPDWEGLSKNAIPQSNFIRAYKKQRQLDKTLPPLRWQPVSFSDIPKFVGRMVIVAEDSRFYWHDGFDLLAFKDAMDYNLSEGKMAFGASTISQQTVKNLFLSGSRSPLRKWHELLLTWSMERNLKKDRILELYLNIAEFGQGIYGVEAASRYYWDKPVSELSRVQAAELAASLPSPRKHNPATRTKRLIDRRNKILRWFYRWQESQEN